MKRRMFEDQTKEAMCYRESRDTRALADSEENQTLVRVLEELE